MKKLKIAYVLPGLSISGGVGVVLQHTNRLLKRGHETFVISMSDTAPVKWFPNQRVPILSTNELPADLDFLVATHWSTSFEVIKLNAKHKCYFVQSDETRFHDPGSDLFYGTHLSYLLNYHYITEAKWIQKWLWDNFDKKAGLVPNGLDRDIFHPTQPLMEKGRKPRILLEGAIGYSYKGMKEAFEVVKDLDVEVWCISSYGKPEPGWRCDRFFEHVQMSKMKEIYSSCDILLKLSKMEGFFGPPLEMMACGGTCVVGKVTGYDEYITEGENALVVDAVDVEGAKQAIQRLIADENLREKLKRNGLQTALNWDWESSVDHLENYFYEITESKHCDFNTTRELTNKAILRLKALALDVPISPDEIVLKKIGESMIFKKVAMKLYQAYMKIKK